MNDRCCFSVAVLWLACVSYGVAAESPWDILPKHDDSIEARLDRIEKALFELASQTDQKLDRHKTSINELYELYGEVKTTFNRNVQLRREAELRNARNLGLTPSAIEEINRSSQITKPDVGERLVINSPGCPPLVRLPGKQWTLKGRDVREYLTSVGVASCAIRDMRPDELAIVLDNMMNWGRSNLNHEHDWNNLPPTKLPLKRRTITRTTNPPSRPTSYYMRQPGTSFRIGARRCPT